MERDILIILTQFQNQSPGGEPFQLAGLMADAFSCCGLLGSYAS